MNTITAQKMNISTAKTPSFKGKWDSTKDGNKYFKTNAGTVMGVLGALGSLTDVAGEKGNKSALLLSVLFGAGLNLATGIYVDKRRNQKVADAEDYINRAGVEKALQDIAEDGAEAEKENMVFEHPTRLHGNIYRPFMVCQPQSRHYLLLSSSDAPYRAIFQHLPQTYALCHNCSKRHQTIKD